MLGQNSINPDQTAHEGAVLSESNASKKSE